MSNITSMFAAVEFIERNLRVEITVADIAEAVSYSLYHFCRTFNTIVHHTPYDYLMRRRLSESARELLETDKKIVEVAFDYQFNSPETYSRAFKRLIGIQPRQWQKQGSTDRRTLMPRLTLKHLQHINKGEYLKPVLVEMGAFQVAGLMTLVNKDEEVISKLWEVFAQELEEIINRTRPGKYYGITSYPNDWEKRGYFYLASMEVRSPQVTSPSLVLKTIPASLYARFIHKGFNKDLQMTLDYIYHTWLPKSGNSQSSPVEIECFWGDFRDRDHEDAERAVYIPVSGDLNPSLG